MAQAQLDVVGFRLCQDRILNCHVRKDQIISFVGETLSLVVRRRGNANEVVLKEGKKTFPVLLETFEMLCDLKIAVQFLDSFSKGNCCSGPQ